MVGVLVVPMTVALRQSRRGWLGARSPGCGDRVY